MSGCRGPVLSQIDGIRVCPLTGNDEFDCEACRAAEQDWADLMNDLEAA